MTSNPTATEPAPTRPDTWAKQLEQLKARYTHVRPPILVALNILLHDPNITVDDAKAQAQLHGTRITAASVSAAQRLLAKADGKPIGAPAAATTASPTPQRPARRARTAAQAVDAEALIRGLVSRLQGQGAADTERLKDAMRKAIAVLQAAVG
jgi:hypothetical protein